MAAVTAHLATVTSEKQPAPQWDMTVTRLSWDAAERVWSVAAAVAASKDSGKEKNEVPQGQFDAVVVADAALMRPGAAGQARFDGARALPQLPSSIWASLLCSSCLRTVHPCVL